MIFAVSYYRREYVSFGPVLFCCHLLRYFVVDLILNSVNGQFSFLVLRLSYILSFYFHPFLLFFLGKSSFTAKHKSGVTWFSVYVQDVLLPISLHPSVVQSRSFGFLPWFSWNIVNFVPSLQWFSSHDILVGHYITLCAVWTWFMKFQSQGLFAVIIVLHFLHRCFAFGPF